MKTIKTILMLILSLNLYSQVDLRRNLIETNSNDTLVTYETKINPFGITYNKCIYTPKDVTFIKHDSNFKIAEILTYTIESKDVEEGKQLIGIRYKGKDMFFTTNKTDYSNVYLKKKALDKLVRKSHKEI